MAIARCGAIAAAATGRVVSCRVVVLMLLLLVVLLMLPLCLPKVLVLAGVFVAGPMLGWVQPAWSKLDNSKALAAKYLPALFFSPTTQVPRARAPSPRGLPVALVPVPPQGPLPAKQAPVCMAKAHPCSLDTAVSLNGAFHRGQKSKKGPVLAWLLGAEEKKSIVFASILFFVSSSFLLQLYTHIHTYANANANASMYVQASMYGYTPLRHARHSCAGAAPHGIASATNPGISPGPGPSHSTLKDQPPSLAVYARQRTLKVSLSGLADGPEAAAATRLPIHLTMRCSSPARPGRPQQASAGMRVAELPTLAATGSDWIRLDQPDTPLTAPSARFQGCRRPSIH